MIVVSDTSPLNYLILINAIDVLPRLFDQVFLPSRVMRELMRPATPAAVRQWVAAAPDWLIVRDPSDVDPDLSKMGGEADAIALAEELSADQILLDDLKARAIASQHGLVVMGTLGVLAEAAVADLLDLRQMCDRLVQTTFRIDDLFDQVARRKQRQ